MKTFIENNKYTIVTLKDIRYHMLTLFPQLAPLSITTLSSYMKRDLKLRYKRTSTRPLSRSTLKNQNHVLEALAIQRLLISNGFILVYLDESSFNENIFKKYAWSLQG